MGLKLNKGLSGVVIIHEVTFTYEATNKCHGWSKRCQDLSWHRQVVSINGARLGQQKINQTDFTMIQDNKERYQISLVFCSYDAPHFPCSWTVSWL